MYATRQEIRRAAGRAIICGFEQPGVTAELREILHEVRPAGLILFTRNVESPEQVAELARELKSLRTDEPLLLCVDQEGGRVARIKSPATEWPPMRLLGRAGDAELARRVGRALALELRAMNIDVDFAPVLDVDTNPDNPVIADRSFSDRPERVAELGTALALGLQDRGVAACGKHFPGHGDTDVDGHLDLPRVHHELSRLREVEWVPFARAIAAGIGAIMTAHVVVEALDERLPATLSRAALAPLRQELGFRGVVVSDDLEMQALSARFRMDQIAVMGMNAGVDLFLVCRRPERILDLYRGIVVGAEQEEIPHDTLLDAEKRVTAWRDRYHKPPVAPARLADVVGCSEHVALARQIEAAAARA